MKKLYVLDASGYLYRSYHAIRNITNSAGESTNALYGFARSVMKLRKDFSPTHLVAVFDGPNGSKNRTAIYSEYKANRAAMPPDLVYQIKWAQQLCQLLGIPYLSIPEVEADDTMGTIAKWAEHFGEVYLCTSDKDLCQFVDDKVRILNTHKENLVLGPNEVKEAFGVMPNQIVDYLAIVGDASDNVPGLPGFGPKTAAALLAEFGTLDNILNNPNAVTGKKKEIVIQFADQARLSRQLVTIDVSVDIPRDDHFYMIKEPDISTLKGFYAQMNFNSLSRELEQSIMKDVTLPNAHPDTSYIVVDTAEALAELIEYLQQQRQISLHVITTDEHPMRGAFVGIGLAVECLKAWYVPCNGTLGRSAVLQAIKPLLENKEIGFFGHNIKHDIQVLLNEGISVGSLCFDTMLASHLLQSHSRQHGIDTLVLEHYGKVKITASDLMGKGKKAICIDQVPIDQVGTYCCETVDYVCRLKELLSEQLKERHLENLFVDMELPLLRVLAKMENMGIYLDVPYMQQISIELHTQIEGIEKEIYELAGEVFNINSPKQMSHILFTKLGIKAPKKTATGLSTNADVLESLKDKYPIAGKILEYRTLEKLRSTYVETLPNEVNPKTKRIHCTFNQMVTATGRLSCQDPNLQNIPIRTEDGRKIRKGFCPQKTGWVYLAADYSQVELRLLAHLCQDPELVRAFIDGEDIHKATAAKIFNIPVNDVTKEQRQSAKAVNFGIVYGQQAFGLSQELGVDVKEAAKFIETYFNRYPQVKHYLEDCKEKARQTGRATTYMGRERIIPEINSKNIMMKLAAERLAINTPIQGTAADLIKLAMLEMDEIFNKEQFRGYMILQIHDELIFELPEEEAQRMKIVVRQVMENVISLKVPLVVDVAIGKNWAEC